MEPAHWIQRWQEGRTGFHQNAPNQWLERFYPGLELKAGDSIFLPLCGKTVDLIWLAEQGQKVLGVELSPIAVEQFFNSNRLSAEQSSSDSGKFTKWESGSISLLEGDFFNLTRYDLQDCRAIFDRAALVALPFEMRQRYVEHLADNIAPDTKILLVTTDFIQEEKSPPPFAISDAEVHKLYDSRFEVLHLHSEDLSNSRDPLAKRGVSSLIENVYLCSMRK